MPRTEKPRHRAFRSHPGKSLSQTDASFNKNYNDTNEHLLLSSGFSDTTGITRQIITFDQDVYSQIKLVVENKGKSEVSLHAYKQNDEVNMKK